MRPQPDCRPRVLHPPPTEHSRSGESVLSPTGGADPEEIKRALSRRQEPDPRHRYKRARSEHSRRASHTTMRSPRTGPRTVHDPLAPIRRLAQRRPRATRARSERRSRGSPSHLRAGRPAVDQGLSAPCFWRTGGEAQRRPRASGGPGAAVPGGGRGGAPAGRSSH